MRVAFWLLAAASVFVGAPEQCLGATTLTGTVVNEEGKPIEGVICSLTGFGGIARYSGGIPRYRTDSAGRFTIPLPRSDPLVDLQFDHGGDAYAPVFRYKVMPAESPLRVVMGAGKLLKGRIVERSNGGAVPVPNAPIELLMPQDDFWYQRPDHTDRNGEFRFRISEPLQKSPWVLHYGGMSFKIDYEQVRPETLVTLTIEVKMALGAEPSSAANGSQPIRSETNSTSSTAGSRR